MRFAAARWSAHVSLSTLTTGNVSSLAIAHEVGHSLGLGHGPAGPMKAEPNRDDLACNASDL